MEPIKTTRWIKDTVCVKVTEGEGADAKEFSHVFRRPTPTERIRYNREMAETYYVAKPQPELSGTTAEIAELNINSQLAEGRVRWYAELIQETDGYLVWESEEAQATADTIMGREDSIMAAPVRHQTNAVRALFEEKKSGLVSAKLAGG